MTNSIGNSFRGGFSFISKSLPRNNQNFVKHNITNISKMQASGKVHTMGTSRFPKANQ